MRPSTGPVSTASTTGRCSHACSIVGAAATSARARRPVPQLAALSARDQCARDALRDSSGRGDGHRLLAGSAAAGGARWGRAASPTPPVAAPGAGRGWFGPARVRAALRLRLDHPPSSNCRRATWRSWLAVPIRCCCRATCGHWSAPGAAAGRHQRCPQLGPGPSWPAHVVRAGGRGSALNRLWPSTRPGLRGRQTRRPSGQRSPASNLADTAPWASSPALGAARSARPRHAGAQGGGGRGTRLGAGR
jgi:hypothetical protein